jgi:steroid delta-isomerase-like uncharacterized protein
MGNDQDVRQEVHRVFDRMLAAMNAHDIEGCVACYSDDAELQDPRFPQPERGKEIVREGFGYWFGAFPDVEITVQNLFLDPPQVAVEWVFEATHKGEYLGVRPSGKRIRVLTAAHFRIEGGFVTRDFSLFDAVGLRKLEALSSEP